MAGNTQGTGGETDDAGPPERPFARPDAPAQDAPRAREAEAAEAGKARTEVEAGDVGDELADFA